MASWHAASGATNCMGRSHWRTTDSSTGENAASRSTTRRSSRCATCVATTMPIASSAN
jgi:hypothetical protein